MLQTVLEIMMSFDSDAIAKRIQYQYSIEYFYKGSVIIIQRSEKHYNLSIDGEFFCEGSLKAVKERLAAEHKSIFPERINYFYSGLNDHALAGMHRVGANYTIACRNDIARYWNALYLANHEYSTVDSPYIKEVVQRISPDATWYFTEHEAKSSKEIGKKKSKLRRYGFTGSFELFSG